ncbi:MAG TPA: DUF1415 domain-containing protein [Polyangiaceae bacterium]|nr:DUF1415 domain-containing protein [Polyangiaceae bacterium]
MATLEPNSAIVLAATERWLERAVIGLGLCPFARAVFARQQIRYVVSAAVEPAALLQELTSELQGLMAADPAVIDTTLLIHPNALADFLEFNAFLRRAQRALEKLGLAGELQLASFHPDYCFADSEPEDAANNSNRAPYPILHLLREASVERALASYPDPDSIYLKNIRTLRALGTAAFQRLLAEPV